MTRVSAPERLLCSLLNDPGSGLRVGVCDAFIRGQQPLLGVAGAGAVAAAVPCKGASRPSGVDPRPFDVPLRARLGRRWRDELPVTNHYDLALYQRLREEVRSTMGRTGIQTN